MTDNNAAVLPYGYWAAVQEEIAKDKRIGGREARALAGRANREITAVALSGRKVEVLRAYETDDVA
jgi:hypothetical protein